MVYFLSLDMYFWFLWQVVCKKISASGYSFYLWLYLSLGWRFRCGAFFSVKVWAMLLLLFLGWCLSLNIITLCFCRYVKIVKEEGLEISQPALDPNSTEIHHRITVRARNKKFHRWFISETVYMHLLIDAYCTYNKCFHWCRRVYERRGSTRCSDSSEGPPCTG
jgi:hypothetical protein